MTTTTVRIDGEVYKFDSKKEMLKSVSATILDSSDEPMTLQEIGEHYGVTREAVRQLESRLIGKIRAAMTGSLGPNE